MDSKTLPPVSTEIPTIIEVQKPPSDEAIAAAAQAALLGTGDPSVKTAGF